MKTLHIFILCLNTVRTLATTTVTAYTGGGINIKCKYEDEHKTKTKSFCKMGTQHRCLSQINTEAHKEWIHKGRFSIQDTKQKGFFSVLIRELTVEDTGTYRCAVGSSDQTYTVVNLNIEDPSYEKTINKNVLVGKDMNITCQYPNSYRSNPKFFCKVLHSRICAYKTSVEESRKAVKEEKISQYDDRAKKVFTVIMKQVRAQDSGEYWCGVEADGGSEHGYKIYLTRINMVTREFMCSCFTTTFIAIINKHISTSHKYKQINTPSFTNFSSDWISRFHHCVCNSGSSSGSSDHISHCDFLEEDGSCSPHPKNHP
ncbi:polymeric immunoglobulin receptor-like [Neoarius graeffei]|uniref:polymeric immunoglobulin receptor-like n=1 Tax=Neoarius graeffei TaxID=443677 RepID=UPI00298D125E|nr:polymeric immunoglobulin receptor-like [Neoarius graeffei]